MRISLTLSAVVLSAGAAFAQMDDILQLKSEGSDDPMLLVGQVLNITDKTVEFQDRKNGKMTIPVESIEPYSLYRVKASRIDDASGKAHFELGEWCHASELFGSAIREFEKAKEKDPSLAEACEPRIKVSREEDARTRFEEAKRLILQKKYEKAAQILGLILRNYHDTPYADKAKEESDKVASALKAENEEKVKMLAAKKKADDDAKSTAKAAFEKKLFTESATLLDEAKKAFNEGLEFEAKDNVTQCRKSWENAERKLDQARLRLQSFLKTADDAAVKEGGELEKELVAWQVKVYWRLGRNYAEHLSHTDALRNLNRALALPHDEFMDRILNELVLTVTQVQMRRRAAGTGG